MPNENRINGLSDIAREIANKSTDTFALVMVDGHRTGNVLGNLLERAFGISKNRITKLGPTSSTLQDAINLSQKRDIVIAPRDIVNSTSPTFSPATTISKLMLVYVTGDSATIQYHLKQDDQFILK